MKQVAMPNPQEERDIISPLNRHFSTIGIDDIFLEPPPCKLLPKSYLGAASVQAADDDYDTASFRTWEIAGTIKSVPEDFVVREIASRKRSPKLSKDFDLVADLAPTVVAAVTRAAPTQTGEDKSKASAQATSDEANKSENREFSHETDDNGDCEKKPAIKATEKRSNETSVGADAITINSSPPTSPAEVVESILVESFGDEKARELLNQIQGLQEKALQCIRNCASSSNYATAYDSDNVVWIPPFPSENHASPSSSSSHNGSRGRLHWNLRLAFSLVKSESVLQKSASVSDASGKQYAIQVSIDDTFFGIAPRLYQPEDDIPLMNLFRNRGCILGMAERQNSGKKRKRDGQETLNDDGTSVFLRLRPNLPREERRPLHSLIAKLCRDFDTSTIPNYCKTVGSDEQPQDIAAIVVKWSKRAQKKAKNKNNGSIETFNANAGPSTNTLFVLKKTRIEHLAAVKKLTCALRCRQSDIGLAGIKDMHAVTYQFCTVASVCPNRVERARSSLAFEGIELGRIQQVDWVLNRGDLEGNHFEVTIRNVKRIHVQMEEGARIEAQVPCEGEHIRAMVTRVRKSGFINFYGEQRLGIPGRTSDVGIRSFDIGRALLQQDFSKAIDLLMTGRLVCRGHNELESPEARQARQIWKETGGDAEVTLKVMPKGDAMSRERTVLQGLKRYGSEDPLAALKCLHHSVRTFWINAYQSYVWNAMASARLKRYGPNVVKGDLCRLPGEEGRNSVRVVDDDSSCVNVADVVLPLPGYTVQYPKNEIGELYHDFLKKENVSFDRGAPPEATARGSYRSLVAFARNLEVSFEGGDTTTFAGMDQDTVADSILLKFDLPSGSYATMLLRELMLTTVTR